VYIRPQHLPLCHVTTFLLLHYALSPEDVWRSKGMAPCIHRHWTEMSNQFHAPAALWPQLEALSGHGSACTLQSVWSGLVRSASCQEGKNLSLSLSNVVV
jgi:hypothetical protein